MNGKILFTVISAIIAITKSVTISHPQNPGGYHIGGVGVKHIREIGYCPPVAVPILFIIESPHVPPDTVKFFIRKLNVLLQHHNGFITMPRKKGCIVIFPTVTFQQRGKGRAFSCKCSCPPCKDRETYPQCRGCVRAAISVQAVL